MRRCIGDSPIWLARGQEMDEQFCREIGANASISKPHGTDALVERIEALLGLLPPLPGDGSPPASS